MLRDTVIKTEADSATVVALLECDSLNRVVMRQLSQQSGRRIEPRVRYQPRLADDNQQALLTVVCREDSLEQVITLREREIEQLREQTNTIEVEKPLGRWDSFVIVCGYIFLAIIVITALVFVAKTVLRAYGIKL